MPYTHGAALVGLYNRGAYCLFAAEVITKCIHRMLNASSLRLFRGVFLLIDTLSMGLWAICGKG